MIEIREANPQDYSLIQKIAHQTWPHTFGNILTKKQIDYMLEMMYSIPALTDQVDKKNHKFILAYNGTEGVGYASYELHYKGLDKTKIHKLYILPEVQGKGIGRLLINMIAELASQKNDTILSLNVNRDNPAIQFYEKIGFIITGEENISIGNGFVMEDFIMDMKINSK
jgi:GNAT superfamily N-acetyltransferase